jgi:hypothetical protein
MRSKYEKQDAKRRRNSIIMGAFLVLVMIISIWGYAGLQSNNSSTNFEYNGFKFRAGQLSNGQIIYLTTVKGVEVGFYNDPMSLLGLNFSDDFKNTIKNAGLIYISYEPIPIDAQIPTDKSNFDIMQRDLSRFSGKDVLSAKQREDLLEESLVVTCENATAYGPVLLVNFSSSVNENVGANNGTQGFANLVSSAGNSCYQLNARNSDVVLMRDYLIYLSKGILT